VLDLATGWMLHAGPVTVGELARVLGRGYGGRGKGHVALEASGAVLRGQFTDATAGATEWV